MSATIRKGPDPEQGRGLDRCVAILGDGRAARHLSCYLADLDYRILSWSRRLEREHGIRLESVAESADVIWILVSDGAIEPLVAAHPCLRQRTLLHASGSLVLDGVIGAHPLMTFGPELYPATEYRRMAFVLDGEEKAFRRALPVFPNPVHTIRPEDRAFYHALCVMAGNFPGLLWQKLFGEFQGRLGLPPEAARPYLERVFRNLQESPATALTGPLARADQETIERNLEALGNDPFAGVYRAFLAAYAAEAEAQGIRS